MHTTETGKNLGSRLQHEIFYLLIRCRLLFVAHLLLRCVVFYYVLIPSVRKRCYPYLQRRFPQQKGFARICHCYKLYVCFAEGLLHRSIMGILGKNAIASTSASREKIKEHLPEDTGCIILTAHIGAWQMGLAGVEQLQRRINIVQWIHEKDTDKHYFEHKEQEDKHAINVINSRDGVHASFAISAALQRKEIVCIAGDRITESADKGIDITFLGDTIYIPSTAFLLASITEVPLIISFSILHKGQVQGVKSEILHLPKNLRRKPQELKHYAQCFANAMEDMVEKYPYHFFNFYDMWESYDSARMQRKT